MISIKVDRRFKEGNVRKDQNGVYRGNPTTLQLKRLEPVIAELGGVIHRHNELIKLQLNPPIVISKELAEAIEEDL